MCRSLSFNGTSLKLLGVGICKEITLASTGRPGCDLLHHIIPLGGLVEPGTSLASVPGRLEKGVLFAHLFADSNLLRPSSGLSLAEPHMELTGDSNPARRGTGSSWGSLGISGPSNVTAVLKGYIRTAPKGFSLFSKWQLLRWAWMITKSISMPVWCHF